MNQRTRRYSKRSEKITQHHVWVKESERQRCLETSTTSDRGLLLWKGCVFCFCFCTLTARDYTHATTQATGTQIVLDCLQSTFSLKIRLVLISSSAIANYDVIITETRRQKTDFFFSGLRPRFSRLPTSPLMCLGFVCSNFTKKNKRLLAV